MLVKCISIDAEIEKIFYVPGIIQVSPLKMKATDNFYTVIKYNTKKVRRRRFFLLLKVGNAYVKIKWLSKDKKVQSSLFDPFLRIVAVNILQNNAGISFIRF